MSERLLSGAGHQSVGRYIWALLPLILLAGVIGLFLSGGAGVQAPPRVPPLEELTKPPVGRPPPQAGTL
jgi:uncharacterized membrane protein YagU involved in acid resistance